MHCGFSRGGADAAFAATPIGRLVLLSSLEGALGVLRALPVSALFHTVVEVVLSLRFSGRLLVWMPGFRFRVGRREVSGLAWAESKDNRCRFVSCTLLFETSLHLFRKSSRDQGGKQ